MVRNWYLDLLIVLKFGSSLSEPSAKCDGDIIVFTNLTGFDIFMRSCGMTYSGILKRIPEFSTASYGWVLRSLTGRDKAYQVELWISKQTTQLPKGQTNHIVVTVQSNQCRIRQGISLQWRHNESDGVSNHRSLHCLLNCWFRHRW